MQNWWRSAEVLGFRGSPRRVQDFGFECASVRSPEIDGESRKDQHECSSLTWCNSSWVFFGIGELLAGTVVDQMSHSFFLGATKSASAPEWFSIQRLAMAVSLFLGIQCFRSELKRNTKWSGQTSRRNSFKQVSASWEPRLKFLQEFLAEIKFEFGHCLRFNRSFSYLGLFGQIKRLHACFVYLFLKIWVQSSASKCSFEPEISEASLVQLPEFQLLIHEWVNKWNVNLFLLLNTEHTTIGTDPSQSSPTFHQHLDWVIVESSVAFNQDPQNPVTIFTGTTEISVPSNWWKKGIRTHLALARTPLIFR